MSCQVAQHDCSALIRRVNQLYHELTQDSFDRDHRLRFKVETRFWESVARATLGACATSHVVVDLACGTGFVAQTLRRWLGPGDRLIAIDLGEAPLKTMARKWAHGASARSEGPRIERLTADAQQLPLADRSVDLVAMNASLHHVPDPAAVLREVDRILAPQGFFALGFEPNRAHFASTTMVSLSRAVTRTSWYASPRQNWRRFRDRLTQFGASDKTIEEPRVRRVESRRRRTSARAALDRGRHPTIEHDHSSGGCGTQRPDVIAAVINDGLVADGLIAEPLPEATLLDLVDPHARGHSGGGGLDPRALIRDVMPRYEVRVLFSSDYLGETVRRWPSVRGLLDTVMRTLAPRHGSLFSWLLRKPAPPSEVQG